MGVPMACRQMRARTVTTRPTYCSNRDRSGTNEGLLRRDLVPFSRPCSDLVRDCKLEALMMYRIILWDLVIYYIVIETSRWQSAAMIVTKHQGERGRCNVIYDLACRLSRLYNSQSVKGNPTFGHFCWWQKDEQIDNTYRFNPLSFSLHNRYDIVTAFKMLTHTDSTSVTIAIQSNFSSYSSKLTTGVVSANIKREPVRHIAAPIHDRIGISKPPDSL